MARRKFDTLTEQMFYILLCLKSECCGMDIMNRVKEMTESRVIIGPGTLYNLLENFMDYGMIRETKVTGRKRSYIITDAGLQALDMELERLQTLIQDYQKYSVAKGAIVDENKEI